MHPAVSPFVFNASLCMISLIMAFCNATTIISVPSLVFELGFCFLNLKLSSDFKVVKLAFEFYELTEIFYLVTYVSVDCRELDITSTFVSWNKVMTHISDAKA